MIKNSLLYIQRKKKKSVIALCIQTAILLSLYICLAINQFSHQVESIIYRAANSSFIIRSKFDQDLIDLKVVKDIKQLDKIERYNLEYETTAHLKDADVFGGKQRVELSNVEPEYKNLLKIYGVSSSHLNNDFTSEVFKIVKGRHIKKDDNNKIIIHEALAKQNHYKIGDTISIKQCTVDSQPAKDGSPKTGTENQYEIVGIFSGKKQESYTGFSSDYSENMAYLISKFFIYVGKGNNYIFGQGPFNGEYNLEESATSNQYRYSRHLNALRANEVLQRNGGSFKWINEAIKATRKLKKEENIKKIQIPILLFQSGKDTFVNDEGHNTFRKYAKNCKFVRFDNGKHELYFENDDILEPYLKEIVKFYNEI